MWSIQMPGVQTATTRDGEDEIQRLVEHINEAAKNWRQQRSEAPLR